MRIENIFVVFGLGMSILVGLVSAVSAAEIKSTPEKQVWIADGQTEYILGIHLDNTGLDGAPTDGFQTIVNNPAGFEYVQGSASAPPVEIDFFSGQPMFDEVFDGPGLLNDRIIQEIGGGPVNSNGFVLEQKYKVPLGFATGVYNFPLSETGLLSSDNPPQPQPHTVSADPIRVAGYALADHNGDGHVDNLDYIIQKENMGGPGTSPLGGISTTDLDGDGDNDLADFAKFQRAYTGDNFVQ